MSVVSLFGSVSSGWGACPAGARVVPTVFLTIQAAVNAAGAGDVVCIEPGTYLENVRVSTASITLLGDGASPDAVVIDARKGGACRNEAVRVTANDVAIKNLRVQNSCSTGNAATALDSNNADDIFVAGEGFVLEHVVSSGARRINTSNGATGGSCVRIVGNGGSVTDSGFFNCQFDGLTLVNIPGSALGSSVRRNLSRGNKGHGFDLAVVNALVDANVAQVSAGLGFLFPTGSNGNTVQNNQSDTSGSFGIEVLGNGAVVSGNSVKGAVGAGLVVVGASPTVANNLVQRVVGTEGIFYICTAACSQGSVSGNVVRQIALGAGYFISGNDAGLLIQNNQSISATVDGFNVATTSATLSGNVADQNGTRIFHSGFLVSGDGNLVSNNIARRGTTGFAIFGNSGTIQSSLAEQNVFDGFTIGGGSNNAVLDDVAVMNHGEGFDNKATTTAFKRVTASANRIDCTNTAPGTLGVLKKTVCSDGSNFNRPSEVN